MPRVNGAHLAFAENLEALDDKGSKETLDLPVVLETKLNLERMDYQAQLDHQALLELQDRGGLWVFLE